MKTNLKKLFLLPALIVALTLLPAARLTAQPITKLHDFSAPDSTYHTNSDGAAPFSSLKSWNNILYATAANGGSSSNGTVFAFNPDGTGFTNLHNFNLASDGGHPLGGVIVLDNNLYGTAADGGSSGAGTVFALNTIGSGFTNLHDFTASSDGAKPQAALLSLGQTLYGTASAGGHSGNGTVFALNTDGSGFTNLHHFTATSGPDSTNSDGALPYAGLVFSGSSLNGVAYAGGTSGNGTVFAVNTDGTGFTNLHSFSAGATNAFGVMTNSDGAHPYAGLVDLGNALVGGTDAGGSSGFGTMFKINPDGTGFTVLHHFAGGSGTLPSGFTNSDGALPRGLISGGFTIYGTTAAGGSSGRGTVFGLLADGTGFTNLHNFSALSPNNTNGDGAYPSAGLVPLRNNLCGTALQGGSLGGGTVFCLALTPPTLNITVSGPYTTLKWPANDPAIFASGFFVQTTIDPLPITPATIWVNLVVPPIVINGQFTVILANSYSAQRIYRLWQ